MILNPKLLQQLRQKLTIGNRRSIHLNALPGNLLNRADLVHLNLLQDKLAEKLIDLLLNKNQFKLTLAYEKTTPPHALPPDEQKNLQNLQKRLNALFYENNDNYLEHGVKPFGIGFPLLIKHDTRDPSKVIKAPVLIWNLDIEKSASFGLKWLIKREEDFAVYLNPMLVAHIETDEGISLQPLADAFNLDEPITPQGIVNICNELLKRLNAGNEYPQATLAVCPGPDTLKNLDFTKPIIRWSAVMGIYKTPKQSIIKDLDNLIKQQTENKPDAPPPPPPPEQEQSFQQHTFACVKTDPSQQAVVNSLGDNRYQIIQGPPGTGKSQSLTAVISNALANGAKCLVVCEKRTALEVVYQNLQAIGLANLAVIIEDIAKDRSKVVDAVRQQLDEPQAAAHHFSEDAFLNLLISAQNSRNTINDSHAFLAQKLINTWNWTDVAGKFLEAESTLPDAKKLTPKLLPYTDFELNAAQYNHLFPLIAQAQTLFEEAGSTLRHPLHELNPMLFLKYHAGELLAMVKEQGAVSLAKLQHAEQLMQNLLQEYAQTLEVHYRQFYAQMLSVVINLQNNITQNINLYGNQFNQRAGLGATTVKTFGFLVGKFKTITTQQTELLNTYAHLQQLHQQHPYFTHTYLAVSKTEPPTFQELLQNINDLQNRLQEWFTPITQLIEQQTANLHYASPHPAADNLTPQIQHIEQLYLQLATDHNKAALLYNDMAEQTQLMATQLMIVQRIAQSWDSVLKNLNGFRAFYEWQRFFLQLQPNQQELVKALINLQPANWQTAFEYWFFNGVLQNTENRQTPVSDAPIKQFAQQLSQLRQMQALKIRNHWHICQHQAAGAFNTRNAPYNIRQLYNKRGAKGQQRNSLRNIIHTDFDVFTAFFPVLLLNPVVCSSILPLITQLFDIVIFDEASQLRVEETYTALLRGKHVIVSGDTHQMPPSSYFESSNALLLDATDDTDESDSLLPDEETLPNNLFNDAIAQKESLLEYAEDTGYRRSYLDFHYRSQHPHLINFSNAAFYASRLVTMPLTQNYKAIRLYELEGVYHKSVNPAEVEKVMHILLHEIQPLPQSSPTEPIYPSVGVATFNIYQRNLLLETIEKQKLNNPQAAEKLAALEAEGLFVKNLENIQGDERDVMIISTTYGLNPDGRFIQNYGPINQAKGYKLLNVIITRARRQVYLCTSIPQTYYSRYAAEIATSGNTGKAVFYAYLTYAKAVETENEDLRQSVLTLLAQHCPDNNQHTNVYMGESQVFVAEIARRLAAHLPADYRVVKNHQAGGFQIDIAIFLPNPDSSPIAIECDNSSAHQSPEAYLHDVYRQEQLHRIGYRFYRTYSANWWLNPAQALQDTIHFITAAAQSKAI